ncbi:AAA family ATPase [Candidatus Woesearchaeota archaeon]|nr:AAA family ATPase [Candidatus Woesearchaeota archaeon]
MINKIKTGIQGLDELLKGGIREKTSILVTGPPGTGKTILGLQFIIEGAKRGEAGIYITSEETAADLRLYAEVLDLGMKEYEKKGLITLMQQPLQPKKLMSIAAPLTLIKSKNVKRVVLDSVTLFEYMYGQADYRREVLNFVLKMKESDVTLITTAEKSIVDVDAIKYEPEDFLFEGMILLTKIRKSNSFENCIYVAKMRGQDHSKSIVPFKIGKGGIKVFPKQPPFSLIERDTQKFK